MEINNENPVSLPELKKHISAISKRDEETSQRVQRISEYLALFNASYFKQVEEIIKKLTELELPRMKEQYIYKLAELMPATPEEVKMVLQGYPLTVSADNLKKIAKTITDIQSKST